MADTKPHSVLGVMSGTSLDGLDLALCSFSETKGRYSYSILKAETIAYSPAWKNALGNSHRTSAEVYAELHHLYGRYIAAQAKRFLSQCPEMPVAIASHGHTVFHQPAKGFSTQLGCGATIAAHTGLTTINDFRSLDVALTGQGAPLVPIGDKLLFAQHDACLNIGGIANVSFDRKGKRIAFDVCPANMAFNFYAKNLGKDYDVYGEFAEQGTCNETLLQKLNRLDFYAQPAPRSLGREWFEEVMLPLMEQANMNPHDALRTLVEHATDQLAAVLNENRIKETLVSGGGAFNSFFITRLGAKYKGRVVVPPPLTINFKEALIFAFLGWLRLQGKTNTLSSVTGARRDSVGGAVYAGAKDSPNKAFFP